ncbi:MAG: TonB-dependent receptor, partial [Bacteroidota bacterium]
NLLRNSDFLTSAFPSEYGNATAGVFDIGFRNGNKDRYEFTAQLAAFSGLEAMAEGPLSAKGGSFVVSYRHSFIELADIMGIPVGTNATPNYKDLSFKVDLPSSKAGKFSIFGIGGLSDIDFLGAEIDETDLFADPNEDAYVESRLGILGVRHNYILGKQAYIRTVISTSTAQNSYIQDNILMEEDRKIRAVEVDDVTNRLALSSYVNKKFNARTTLRTGILIERSHLDTRVDDRDQTPDLDGDGEPDWFVVRDFDGAMILYQAYAQMQYKLSETLTLNGGLHGQYLDYNDSYAVEPRMALNWQFKPNQTLTVGYGLHHQMQPLPIFFFEEEVQPDVYERTNEDLDFTRSNHFVLGYDVKFGTNWRAKVETYYQSLSDVPVEAQSSSFSILNAGADFVFPEVGSLENTGTGSNYGVELTIEKFFSKGYYGLLTTSIFESTYEGSDGVERNTAFNNNYVVNVLAGKEIKIGKDKRNALTFDMKMTTAGGRYYTPVDLQASRMAGTEILQEDRAFSERFDPYFRLDVKFGILLNSAKRKFSQQFFLDFQNITNNENVFDRQYNRLTNEVNTVLQSGFFPDIMYRVQF